MNKKLLSIKTLLVAAGLCVGASAWADNYTSVWNQSFTSSNSGTPAGWSLSSTDGVTQSYPTIATHVVWQSVYSKTRTLSMSQSSNTVFTSANSYKFEFYWNTSACYGYVGNTTLVVNSDNTEKVLFSTSAPKGDKTSATSTVYKADGTTTITTLSHTNFADPTTLYKFTIEGLLDGVYLTIDNVASDGTISSALNRTKIYDTPCHVTGLSGELPRAYNRYAIGDLDFSYNTTQMASLETSLLATYNSIKSSVMNSTVYNSLVAAATSSFLSPAETDRTSVIAWNTALTNLSTAITNAQASINNFIILNDLISNANTFATTVTEYSAPTDAESVYSSNADIDPLALATAVRNEIARASVAHGGGTDITAMIANSGFELGSMTGWSVTTKESDTDVQVVENSGAIYGTDGFGGTYFFNSYPNGNTLSQNIGTLKAGKYTLSANAASSGATLYLVVNGTPNTGNVTNAVANLTYTFTLASDAEVTIAISGGDNYTGEYLAEGGNWWYKCDDFSLTYVGQDELAQAKSALTDEISAATTVKNNYSAKVGTAPFLYPSATYNTLATELTEAQAIIDANGAEVDAYTDAKDELETAKNAMTSASQNLPAADKYYRIFMVSGGAKTAYNLNLTRGAIKEQVTITEAPYPVKIIQNGDRWNIKTPYDNILQTDNALGVTKAYTNGFDGADGRCSSIWIELNDDGFVVLHGYRMSGTWYNYTAASASEGAYVNANSDLNGVWTISDAVDIDEVNLSVNATAGWGTFIAPYDNLTPSTVKAYTVSYTENNVVYFTENETGVLSANTPYILSTEEAEGVSTTFKGIANNDEDTYSANGLVGLLTASTVPADSYVLQYNDGKVGFYKTTSSITGTANRCYLDLGSVPTEASSRASVSFDIFDEGTAGISQIENGKMKIEGVVYNLNGQRVSQPAKGLYINNGKKVIIK